MRLPCYPCFLALQRRAGTRVRGPDGSKPSASTSSAHVSLPLWPIRHHAELFLPTMWPATTTPYASLRRAIPCLCPAWWPAERPCMMAVSCPLRVLRVW